MGAAATLSGRGDGPARGPAENRLATAVRARTVGEERPDKVFWRVTVNIGKTLISDPFSIEKRHAPRT